MALRGMAILFDIDGTLVDSTPVVERSWHTWAQEYDVDIDDLMQVRPHIVEGVRLPGDAWRGRALDCDVVMLRKRDQVGEVPQSARNVRPASHA